MSSFSISRIGPESPRIMAGDSRSRIRAAWVIFPFGDVKVYRRAESEVVAEDSRNRVGVRVGGHLLPPVPGNGPPVQFRSADLAIYESGDLPVVLRAERPRKLHVHGLRGRQRPVKALPLACQRNIALVRFIGQEDRLRLPVRPERYGFGASTFAPEPREDARKSRPDFRQRANLNHRWATRRDSVLKIVQNWAPAAPCSRTTY